jgi:hypothetical protein|tara:strand:+ start:201 stop:326 length:126 start_codon:yes stop_codon:yes gene_type:complete
MSSWWKKEKPVVIKQIAPTLGRELTKEYLKKLKNKRFKRKK